MNENDTINTIQEEKNNYGKNNIGNNQKINIEIINNHIEEIDITDIITAIYGDNLYRILSYNGYDVTLEYFNRDKEEILTKYKQKLEEYRIYLNIITEEESLYDSYIIEDVINKFRLTNECTIDDNKLYLNTSKYGSINDEILIDENGQYTDFAILIAHQIDKINRNYHKIINIYNEDYYSKSIEAALKILNYDDILDTIILGIDNLTIKEEIEINTLRYISSSSEIKIENQNQLYLIEETYKEICSILKNNKKNDNEYVTLTNNNSYTIINKLELFKDIVIKSSIEKNPTIISNYIYELSLLTKEYIEIITKNEYINKEKNILYSIKITLENALDLLGIIPKEEM